MKIKSKKHIIWGLIAIILIVSIPLMTNYVLNGVNTRFYLYAINNASWSNISLLVPSILIKLGVSVTLAYKIFLLLLNIVTALIAYICFGKLCKDDLVGLVGSMLYTWTPYRINDLYCRGDLGETIALCFLPIVLLSFYRIYTDDVHEKNYKYLWILPAIGFTCILQSYILTFYLVAGVTVLFCLISWKKTFCKQRLWALAKIVVSVGIFNIWMWFPFLKDALVNDFLINQLRGNSIQKGGVYLFYYLFPFFRDGDSAMFFENGMQNSQPMGVGIAVTIFMLVFLWLLFVGRYNGKEDSNNMIGFGKIIAIVSGILMIMSTNSFPWDYLQNLNPVFSGLIACIQSPSRLMSIVTVCLVFVVCITMNQIKKWEKPYIYQGCLITIIVIAVVSTQFLTNDILSKRPPVIESEEYKPGEFSGEQPEELDISILDYIKYL